jgi:hypothetical protein
LTTVFEAGLTEAKQSCAAYYPEWAGPSEAV